MGQGIENQPLSSVEWVKREVLHSNDYNPNHVARPELRLLKQSILASGWTQPIVARPDGEIVDGFHRWTISADPEIAAMTGGLIPVVRLKEATRAEQIAATVRHNRARGEHGVEPMANLVRELIEIHQNDPESLRRDLGMEDEEIERLADRSGMPTRVGQAEFTKGWVPH